MDKIRENLIDLKRDGSFRLNMEYFDFATGLKMTNKKFNDLFGLEPRKSEHENITANAYGFISINSKLTEEIVIRICKYALKETSQNLCLTGGVALNCIANGKFKKFGFK